MSTIADLYDLQEIDLGIDGKRAALTEAEERVGETEELLTSRTAVDEQKESVAELRRRLREAEQEVDDLAAKIAPLEKKLYGGTVRNPKELSDLQEDVKSLQRRKRVLEDRALEVMSEMEEAERTLRSHQKENEEIEAAWNEEQERLQREQVTLKEEIAQLEGQREQQRSRIEAGALALYDALRPAHQGRAVAKVERGTCGGCRISLPMSLLQKTRAGSSAIIQCASCERILYVS